MNLSVFDFTDITVNAISVIWLPLLIWTIIALSIWMLIRSNSQWHPQYHYHTRLALLLSLPTGFLTLFLIWGVESMLLWNGSEPYDLTFITVMAPLEATISNTNSPTLSGMEIFTLSVLSVFFLGVIVTLSSFLVKYLQLRKIGTHYHTFPIETYNHIESENIRLVKKAGKKIFFAFVETDVVPVTFGYRKPVILLPASLKDNPRKCNLAIRHELTHITQNDFISHILAVITQSLFWFHPLVHQLKRELIEYRELRCDSILLTEESVSKKMYASLLLELLPMPNINKELSVNMAQESSNLKKRIEMITKTQPNKTIPSRSSLMLFGILIVSTVIAMACTDLQNQNVFDEEELDLMTNIDRTGEQGFHEIVIFMSEEEQAQRHESKLEQLKQLEPEHIESIHVWKGDQAVEQYGTRGEKGVIVVRTKLDTQSYNTTLQALGMNPVNPQELSPGSGDSEQDDFFVVVEEMPEIIGGLESIQREIRYPEQARNAGIEGRVFVQFVVDEDGSVDDPKIIRGIGGGADEEALRVVSQARFKPGMQRGQPVRVQYSLPIFFRLAGNESVPEQSSNYSTEGDNPDQMTVIGYGGNDESRTTIHPEVIHKQMGVNVEKSGNRILGKIIDQSSGEPLSGANIIFENGTSGTATNADGEFSTQIEENISRITVSYIGYQAVEITL